MKRIQKESSNLGMGLVTESARETKKLGKNILSRLAVKHQPLIIALTGDLGSGKTTFVQGLANGLGIKQRILSPTFLIMRSYSVKLQNSKTPKFQNFYHVDLYRLDENIERQMRNLGMDEILADPGNIVVIEWAEKAKKVIPKDAVWVKFKNLGGDRRRIKIVN